MGSKWMLAPSVAMHGAMCGYRAVTFWNLNFWTVWNTKMVIWMTKDDSTLSSPDFGLRLVSPWDA